MATYYLKRVDGTIRYAIDAWPTTAGTSAASLQAAITALDAGGHELVIYPDTYAESINHADDNIIIRTASLLELDGLDDPTVTIGPPPSANYTLKVANGISAIQWKGAFRFIGFNGFNFGTVSFQSGCSDIYFGKLGDYRPYVVSANDAGDFPMYIFGDGSGHPSGVVVDGVDFEATRFDSPTIKINLCKNGIGNEVKKCTVINTGDGVEKGTGIHLIDTDGWLISENIIGDIGRIGTGIALSNSDNNLITHNTITKAWNGLVYPGGSGHGVNIYFGSENNAVMANKILECNRGVTITSNSGINGNVISFNIVVDSQVNGIDQQASVNFPTYIINNTVIHRPLGGSGHGIVSQLSGKKSIIKNNIVYAFTNVEIPHNIQCVAIGDTTTPSVYDVDIDNNVYITEGTACIGSLDVINYETLDEWRAALAGTALVLSKDANSRVDAAAVSLDGRINSLSLAAKSALVITGVNDGAQADPWGNPMLTHPNIGADQFDYAPGFGPWTPFDSTLPALALSPTAPGDLRSVQMWSKVATAQEIHKVAKVY